MLGTIQRCLFASLLWILTVLCSTALRKCRRRTFKAVEAAVRQGIEVALVTGRRFDFALPIAMQIGCPLTMIVNNGALVKSKDGQTHMRHLLDRETARDVLRLMPDLPPGRRRGVRPAPRKPGGLRTIDWHDPRRKAYYNRNREFISQVSPLEKCLTEDPIQVMYSGSVEPMQRAEVALRAASVGMTFSLAVTYYPERDFGMVDVIRPNCSKGTTLAEWTAMRGLKREEVMAIGDNFNDREMLEFAGLPIVMANSVPELKTQGWRETLSNDEGGVAAAIVEYALETT